MGIIPNPWLRLVVSLVAAFIVEDYAIAVMVLDQQVQQYNASRGDEAPIRYNAGRAKLNYLILVGLVVLFGHVLPELFGPSSGSGFHFPREITILSLLPMLLISWYGYEMFSVNYTLRDRLVVREKQQEDERLDKATQAFAERGRATAEAEVLREKRLLEEAVAQQRKAEARIAREERLKSEVKPVVVSPGKNYEAPQNGHGKPWDERSFAEIEAALKAGEEPPPIRHLQTWDRYQRLCENYFEYGQQFDIKACQLVGVNAVRFRKGLKLLASHRLVREVGRGVYVLVEPERI